MRSLEEMWADFLALEIETEELLGEILVDDSLNQPLTWVKMLDILKAGFIIDRTSGYLKGRAKND